MTTAKAAPVKKSSQSDSILFEVDGFQAKEGCSYKIQDVKDPSAPKAVRDAGATKVPSKNVGEIFGVNYYVTDMTNPYESRVWDNGFTVDSPMYQGKDPKEVKMIVAQRRQNILVPFRSQKGNTQLFEPDSATYHQDMMKIMFTLNAGKELNMANAQDRMTLYMALLHKKLVPEKEVGSPNYKNAPYKVVDKEFARSQKSKKHISTITANSTFMTMLKTEKSLLYAILEFMGRSISSSTDEDTVLTLFGELMDSRPEFAEDFLKNVDLSSGEDRKNSFFVYQKLNAAFAKREVIKAPSGNFEYKGVNIGPDLKGAAHRIATQDNFSDIKNELLIG